MEERRVELRDGTVAVVRPIRPDDRERLRRGLRELSSESRYLRFHAPVSELDEEQLTYLTEVDQHDHVAWVTEDPDEPDAAGMGVARYVRLPDEPLVAEAAVTVADRYQGRGVGTLLLEIITQRAAENGVETLRNYVLAENEKMLDVLDSLGAHRQLLDSGVWQVDVPVPRGTVAGTAVMSLMREISRGSLGSGWRTVLPGLGRRLRAHRSEG